MESKISSSGRRPVRCFQKSTKRRISSFCSVLAQLAVGVAEDAGVGVLGQERQHPLLPPAPLGDVVLLDQGVVAVEGDRVEVEVERRPPLQAQAADRVEPVAHQLRVAGRVDAATVLGQERPLGDDVQAGEQGQPLVEHGAHDVAVARVAEELQGQQRPHGAGGRDHLRAGEAAPAEDAVQVGERARSGRNRNRPPNLVRTVPRASGRAGGHRRHRP